jgi:hypothetical protein
MSRLDSFIRRMQAQRDILNRVAPLVRLRPGPVLEVGLGNGRTYDHLRELLPGRPIYVFDLAVHAHPDCIPSPDMLFLGDAKDTLVEARRLLGKSAVLIHCDLGTGDAVANAAMAPWLGPRLAALLADGGVAVVNQPLDVSGWRRLPAPPGMPRDRYFAYVSAGLETTGRSGRDHRARRPHMSASPMS